MNQTSNDSCRSLDEVDVQFESDTVVELTYYTLALLLGLPGNAIIIQVYAWKKRQTSTNILIIAQAIVDIVACLFMPVFIIRSSFPDLITAPLCRVAMTMEELLALASLSLTAAISVDRYVVVCHPLRRRMTKRMMISLVVSCAAIAIAFSVFMAVLLEFDGDPCSRRIRCKISRSERNWLFVLIALIFGAVYAGSFTTTSLFYALIYAFLRKRAKIHADLVDRVPTAEPTALAISSKISPPGKRQDLEIPGCSHDSSHIIVEGPTSMTGSSHGNEKPPRLMKTDLSSPSSSVPAQSHPPHLLPKQAKIAIKEPRKHDFGRKTTSMLLVVSIFLFVTWIPKLVITLIYRWKPHLVEPENNHMKAFLSALYTLRVTNHVVNFFVYYFVNNSFRRDVKELFKKCKGNIS